MNSEDTLLQRIQHFDTDALAEVYDQFSPAIFRYATRLLGDPGLAEDCVAETFSRMLIALRQGQGPKEYLQAYLYRVAHNWITDQYRRRTPPSLPLETETLVADGPDPHTETARRHEHQRVRAALSLLTSDQRQVIAMKYLEDQSNEAVAAALGKPVSAVKSLQHRALASLRRILFQEEDEI